MFEALLSIAVGLSVSAAVPTVGTYSIYQNCCIALSLNLTATTILSIAHAEAANAIGPPLMIIGILFAGFYIKIGSLPIVANWVPYFSLFRWTFEVTQTLAFVTH